MHTQFRVSDDHKLRALLKKQSAKVGDVGCELLCMCACAICGWFKICPANDFFVIRNIYCGRQRLHMRCCC
jgi:hypothetical protein